LARVLAFYVIIPVDQAGGLFVYLFIVFEYEFRFVVYEVEIGEDLFEVLHASDYDVVFHPVLLFSLKLRQNTIKHLHRANKINQTKSTPFT